MTATLVLTDGVDSVDFVDGTNYDVQENGLDKPMPKKRQVFGGASFFRDGTDLIEDVYENREVTIRCNVRASSSDLLDQRLQDILALIETARDFAKARRGRPVELQYKKDGATDLTYFDVLDGVVIEPDTMHSVLLQNYVILGLEVKFTCKPFVRGPLTSCLGATTIYNHDDTDHNNYVDISGSDISGDVKSAAKFWFYNDSGSTFEGLRVTIMAADYEQLVSNVKEGEDEQAYQSSASEIADATCSGSLLVRVGSGSFAEAKAVTYDLAQNLTEELAGWYRVMARAYVGSTDSAHAGLRCKWNWTDGAWWTSSSTTTVAACTWEMVDLGLVQFPPFALSDTWIADGVMDDPALRRFDLYTRLSASTVTLDIDYFEFFPMTWGLALGGSVALSDSRGQLFDSVSNPAFTARTGSSGSLIQMVPGADWAWSPLYLEPGLDNRVIVSIDRDSGCNVAADPIVVSASYQARHILVR